MRSEQSGGFDTETLYRDLFTPLFRYIFFRTHDRELASDITQTSFVKFLESDTAGLSCERAQKRLFVIARNTLIDHWRSSGSRRTDVTADMDAYVATTGDQEQALVTGEDIAFVKTMLATLNEREAEVVSLRLSDELSYKQIAAILNESEVNVRQLYSRALKKLRTQFAHDLVTQPHHGTIG